LLEIDYFWGRFNAILLTHVPTMLYIIEFAVSGDLVNKQVNAR